MIFKSLKSIVTFVILFSCLIHTPAQAQFESFDNDFLSGFSEDGRIKILLLKFAPLGALSETSAEEFVSAMQRHLSNTNHFTLVGPEEFNVHFPNDSIMADCSDIACGIQIGKKFNADKVLVGQVTAGEIVADNGDLTPGFLLSIRLMDVLTNTVDLTDEIQFTDDSMQDQLFALANQISMNTHYRGHVLSAKKKNLVIDLGRAHGLKIGDRIVVYKQSSATSLEGDTIGLEQNNTAVAEINRLNNMSADAIVLYHFKLPETGDFFKTYLNPAKQIQLVEETRRELDTKKRLTRSKRPLLLKPEVIDNITGEPIQAGKEDWQKRMAVALVTEKRWMYYTIGGGVATLLFLTKKVNLSDNLHEAVTLLAAAGTGYSGFKYFQARNEVNALRAEGRVKNFTYQFRVQPQGVQLALNYRF